MVAKPLLGWKKAILHLIHHLLVCQAAMPQSQERFRKRRREGKNSNTITPPLSCKVYWCTANRPLIMAPVTVLIYTSQGKMVLKCSVVLFFFFFLHRVKRFFCLMCNIGKFISVHKFLRISHVLILSTVYHLSSSKVLIFKMRWLFQRDALLSLQLSCQSVQTSLISSGIWTHFKISTHTLWDPIPSSNLL